MHPEFEPHASLRIWAIELPAGTQTLRVPPLPAADWLPVVMSGNPLEVFDIADDFDVTTAITDDGVTAEQLVNLLGEMIEAAAGRSLRATFGIALTGAQRWDVIGADLARAGVRFAEISLGAALDAIYGSIVRHMPDEKALAAFNRALQTPESAADSIRKRVPRNAPPLPASAMQYVQTRPKTVPRRPQTLPDGQSVQPTPPLPAPDDSDRLPTSDFLPLPGVDVVSPPAG